MYADFHLPQLSDFKISINLMGVEWWVTYFNLLFLLIEHVVINNMENATLSYTTFLTEENIGEYLFKSFKRMTS